MRIHVRPPELTGYPTGLIDTVEHGISRFIGPDSGSTSSLPAIAQRPSHLRRPDFAGEMPTSSRPAITEFDALQSGCAGDPGWHTLDVDPGLNRRHDPSNEFYAVVASLGPIRSRGGLGRRAGHSTLLSFVV